MSARPSLLRDMSHYLSGRLLLVLMSFATFPLMLRVLSVSHYGVVSLVLRVILLLTVLSKCGLQYSAGRFYKGDRSQEVKGDRRSFYSTLVLGPVLTSATVFFVYLPLLFALKHRLADPVLFKCLVLAPVLVLIRTLQSLLLSLLRNEGQSRLHSVLEVISKLLTLAALGSLLVRGLGGAFLVLAAMTVTESATVAFQLASLVRRRLLHFDAVDWSLIRTAIVFGAPLIAYELSSIVLDSGDRFLVRYFLGDQSLGFYSAAYNISGSLQETVMTPLNLAIFPVYMKLWNEDGREATIAFLSKGLTWFSVVAIALTGLSILCSREVIVLLASPRFLDSARLVRIIVPALMLYSTHIFLNVGLVLEKRTGVMSLLVFLSALANLGLNLVLIPRAGLIGAAWSTLISYLIMVGALAIINQRILPLIPDLHLIASAALAAVLSFALTSALHITLLPLSLAAHITLFLLSFAAILITISSTFRRTVFGMFPSLPQPSAAWHTDAPHELTLPAVIPARSEQP